jgi:hypothetical protein
MNPNEKAALERLIEIARRDTGQSRRVADFLLAWWNAGACGSFDLTTLWGVDDAIAADMVTVFGLIARVNKYPDALGYETEFKAIVRKRKLKGVLSHLDDCAHDREHRIVEAQWTESRSDKHGRPIWRPPSGRAAGCRRMPVSTA